MTSNPYEFRNVDADAADVGSKQLSDTRCVEFPEDFDVVGNLDRAEALRLLAKCKPIGTRDPRTGRIHSTVDGKVFIYMVVGCVLYLTGDRLVSDLRERNFATPNLIFWLTTVTIPLCTVVALFVLMRKHAIRPERSEPPIWGKMDIQFRPQWFAVARRSQDGVLGQVMKGWPGTTVHASKEAWLFNRNANPVLIPKAWLTEDQRAAMEQFVDELVHWQVSPAARKLIADFAPNFPPLPTEGISYRLTAMHFAELEAILPEARKRFPNMPKPILLSKPIVWKLWGVGLFVSAICYPVYVLFTNAGSPGVVWLIPLLLAWWMYSSGRGMNANHSFDLAGLITDSKIWTESKAWRGRCSLRDYSNCTVLNDIILLSTPSTKTPLAIARSTFVNEAEWPLALQKIEAAIASRERDGTAN